MLQVKKNAIIFVPSKMHHHEHNPKSDLLGMISSGLCLIHCLAGPVLVLLGYGFIEPDGWHIWDVLFLLVSGWAVYSVTKGHSMKWIKWGLRISILVLSLSIFFSHELFLFTVLSWMAAISLVVFHFFNFRHIRSCAIA
ncbi:MAG: MerC family mercury resistance protein [Bacteroidetes bacterium]|nr:MerC family mercury resistance protein [Bacteroidota bacterium]